MSLCLCPGFVLCQTRTMPCEHARPHPKITDCENNCISYALGLSASCKCVEIEEEEA